MHYILINLWTEACLEHRNRIDYDVMWLRDNCIQIFHFGKYIVGYTVGNLVLRRRLRVAVKRDFRTYIRRYTSSNENFEYDYPHSNALLTFFLQKRQLKCTMLRLRTATASCIIPLASCIYSLVNQWKATLCNDVEFPTVYRRIYCHKFLTNQTFYPIRRRVTNSSALE